MSNGDKTIGHNALKVSKFDHSSTTPRAMRWRDWEVKLRYAFGSSFPLLANQTSESLDPSAYWWGLTWNAVLDIDNLTQEQEQKLYVDFQKAQYSLLHVLSENFGTHEKQIIADHDPVQLVVKLTAKHTADWDEKLEFFPNRQGWTPTKWMTTWLPFGYMCLHNIAAKYIDTGVTDAITKHDAYVASKAFTPSNITKWVSTVEHAWAGWRNTVTDPEHMAAVELVREILSSDNEDWKQWAFSFATQQGDKPYTVADLLEKVVNQDKLLNAGGTKKKATALYAGHSVTQTGRHLGKKSPDDDSSALDDVPASVREQNHHRKLNTLKKKMAQLGSIKNKPKREALLQEANALLVDVADALVKKNKTVRIEESDEEEANLAELPVNTHTPTASPNPKLKEKKTAQDDEFDRTLAQCTVQRFAGCSVPSNYSL